MVYALLHRQEVFEPFRMHVRFADILDNIQVCVLNNAHTRHTSIFGNSGIAATHDKTVLNPYAMLSGLQW